MQLCIICPICKKEFHVKPSRIKRTKNLVCCSKECSNQYRTVLMSGENNHQYGLKGPLNASFKHGLTKRRNNTVSEQLVYVGVDYPNASEYGRVPIHRYLVETNHALYDDKFFIQIKGYTVLKHNVHVHHIDGNHSNNKLSNLMPIMIGEHIAHHNRINPQPRDESSGRFISRQ